MPRVLQCIAYDPGVHLHDIDLDMRQLAATRGWAWRCGCCATPFPPALHSTSV